MLACRWLDRADAAGEQGRDYEAEDYDAADGSQDDPGEPGPPRQVSSLFHYPMMTRDLSTYERLGLLNIDTITRLPRWRLSGANRSCKSDKPRARRQQLKDNVVMLAQPSGCRPFWCLDVEAPGAMPNQASAKVGVECHYYQIPRQGVLDDHRVVICRKAGIANSNNAVPAALQEISDWLDHILVGQKP